jgi:Flp pilus assembly protein TadB
MSTGTLALLLGMLAGAGATMLLASRIRHQPHLGAAMDRLHPAWQVTTPTATAAPAVGGSETRTVADRVGYWLQRHIPAESWGAEARDLAVLRMSPHTHLWRKAAGAGIGFAVPAVLTLLAPLTGLGVLATLPAAIALIGMLVGWYAPNWSVRSAARRARADSLRAIGAYYDLVVVKLANAAAPETAIREAAQVGDSWVFVQIRQALVHATEVRGEPGTAGLAALGAQNEMPQLSDMADIITLSTAQGAAVRELIAARADGLRTKILADDHAAANAANTKLSLATGGLAVTVMGLLITPAFLALTGGG